MVATISAETLFTALGEAWVEQEALWDEGRGFAAIRGEWLQHAAGLGAPIAVSVGGDVYRGTFETIDDDGRLIVRATDGSSRAVSAGEVYFGAAATCGVLMGTDELVFVALGGVGEIGMNLALYGYGHGRNRQWLAVDLGVAFGLGDELPGVDGVLPDIRYLLERKGRARGDRDQPRARGSFRRADGFLAAAPDAGVHDALCSRAARGKAGRRS